MMHGMITRTPDSKGGIPFYRLVCLFYVAAYLFFATALYRGGVLSGLQAFTLSIVSIVFFIGVVVTFIGRLNRKWFYAAMFGAMLGTALVSEAFWATRPEELSLSLPAFFSMLLSMGVSRNEKYLNAVAASLVIGMPLFLLLSDTHPEGMVLIIFAFFGGTIVATWILLRIKIADQETNRMRESLLQSIVSTTDNAIFITDTDGVVFDVNDQALFMFGYSREQLIDHDFRMLRKNALTQGEIFVARSEFEKGKFWTTTRELIHADGQILTCRISVVQIAKKGREFLVYRVTDMTDAIENEKKLLHAKEEAEKATRAKSHFVATVSHEIRTPLNGVIGMASVLRQTDLDHEQKSMVETILSSGNDLVNMINEVLDFSKIESGRMELQSESTDFRKTLFEVTELFNANARMKNLSLQLDIHADVPQIIFVDGGRIRQVLRNLLSNAVKFTDYGHIMVRCRVISRMRDQVIMEVEVEDSGIGIPESQIGQLFQAFSQLDNKSNRRFRGSGLGLAISRQLMTLLNGSISVKSIPGKGSLFSVIFPAQLAESEVKLPDPVLPEPQEMPGHLRVLIAEDNEVNQMVLLQMLTRAGLKPDVAESGQTAVNMIRERGYDIVLMDLQMPGVDGLQAARMVRDDVRIDPKPTIVAISANNSDDDRKTCEMAGMQFFLPKPFTLEQLYAVLGRFSNGQEWDNRLRA
ncbi:MAG: response regulator [Flavobacteriales bacterium]|nr:response regulator [Flavobacteriales bacterium]